MTSENSPSKLAASEMPLAHLISAAAVVSAALRAGAAPSTTKVVPGSAWKVAAMLRSGLKSCAQAARPRRVRIAAVRAKDLSPRRPNSLRDAVAVFARVIQREGAGAGDGALGIGRQVEAGHLRGGVGREANATHHRRDDAMAGFDAAGERIGIEPRAQLLDTCRRSPCGPS